MNGKLYISSLAFAASLSFVGCSTEDTLNTRTPATSENETQDDTALELGRTPSTQKTSDKLSSKLASIQTSLSSSEAAACLADPVCLESKLDQLVIEAGNYFFLKYSKFNLVLAGGVNAEAKAGSRVTSYELNNTGSGFAISQKVSKVFSALPASGKAVIGGAITAVGGGQVAYGGAGAVYVDLNRKLIAVGGADNLGYSYCYYTLGFVPVCLTSGW